MQKNNSTIHFQLLSSIKKPYLKDVANRRILKQLTQHQPMRHWIQTYFTIHFLWIQAFQASEWSVTAISLWQDVCIHSGFAEHYALHQGLRITYSGLAPQ